MYLNLVMRIHTKRNGDFRKKIIVSGEEIREKGNDDEKNGIYTTDCGIYT